MMRMFLGLPQCAVVLFKLVGFVEQKNTTNLSLKTIYATAQFSVVSLGSCFTQVLGLFVVCS
jgi:hypothetical protein